jgi:hypothetical protein
MLMRLVRKKLELKLHSQNYIARWLVCIIIGIVGGFMHNSTAWAQSNTPVYSPEEKSNQSLESLESSPEAESPANAISPPAQTKTFDGVLADLLNEFGYDLKTGTVKGNKLLSVRRVTLNESIPKSYERHLENMVGEKILKHSNIKVIQCPTCRTKKTIVEKGRVKIIVPVNHPAELDSLATYYGIEAWMDVGLLYQETNMILAFNIFDSKTKELLWSKNYNSENIYREKEAAAKALAEPQKKAAEAKQKEEEAKESIFSLLAGYQLVPNVKEAGGMAAFTIYGAERLAEGHIELGASLSAIVDPDMIISNYTNVEGDPVATGEASEATSTASIKPFEYGASFLISYQVNFFKGMENTKSTRTGASLGAGLIWAPGYVAFTARGGGTVRMGKRFTLMAGVLYSAPTTISISEKIKYTTKGGVGGDVGIGFSF